MEQTMPFKKYRKKLKQALDKDRYQHTIGVAYTATSLAMSHGYDINKAYLAGLMHDCAKCIPLEEKLQLCKKYHVKLTQSELDNPALIHAKLGAYVAKKQYGIEDEDILLAIRYHTTGRPEMSLLEKIIYIADYIEPYRRPLPNMKEIRETAFRDIDEALIKMMRNTLSFLESKNQVIDSLTREACEYYINQKPN